MDALDILSDLDHVIPFFQPIFSADEHRIIAYEILGRFQTKEETISLGPFFQDKEIPEEYRLEVDLIILEKAFNKAKHLEKDILFFINRDAELLIHDEEEKLLQLITKFSRQGLNPNRIVLEVSERNSDGKSKDLDHLLRYYRTFGMKIAIDKMGNDSSHLDRISQLEPDILKVDLQVLRSTAAGPTYQNILFSLSMLARKIGAALLFENIETAFQLQFAWKNGGRFYQGFYLSKPQVDFLDRGIMKERLKQECHEFILSEKKKLENLFSLREEFDSRVQDMLNRNRKVLHYTQLLEVLSRELDEIAFRMYICDEDGFQKSPNLFKLDDSWLIQPEYEGKNWSWRPYFLENIIKMRNEKKGILSDRYNDIETGVAIRTFCLPINSQHFLFIDLSSSYLFDREGLF
ncbi:EAL domain, c-di-GMP-specific phosphodiesterase class I (or its enzymatically inactive variant) [Mesobacillus persicus]|uniref:EAL domain, c-di-GMP-specific phosphodiesterase class I (Or its enzymatically inactive variant) n=1 Tax=Mesobacillus persicus TaxID=930146 RepID=A0A1H8FLQ6_9BACI|nr:EAL domain-containing protein [Mesobacillus persicus]SEN32444.1 EAL domain, c-di-GMP-specific phosphodiesterase class I (or its enzymatically inactive variant) [Mesobacillus persicus]